MGNSIEKGLCSDEELEVRASLVIRKKKNESRVVVEKTRRREAKDQVVDDPGLVGDGKRRRPPRAVKEEDNDDGHQEEKFEEDEVPKQRRAKIRIKRSRAPVEIKDRPLSSGSKVSGEDNNAPAKKKLKGNSGRPSSVTICNDSDNPSIDIRISRSHLSPAFSLSLPPAFVRDYMSLETQYRILHGGSCQYLSVCVSGRRFMVKRQQWKVFVEEHGLRAGDMVHLEVSSSKQEVRLEIFRNRVNQGIVYDEDPTGSEDFEEELLEEEEDDEEVEEEEDDGSDSDGEDVKEREREEIEVLGSTKKPKSKKGMVPVPVF